MAKVSQILAAKGPDVIVVCPEATVLEVCKLMAEADVGSVIVRDGDELVGIFTERDLLKRVVTPGKSPAVLTVADVMSSPIQTCGLDEDAYKCAERFRDSHIRHLAVVEDGALVGVIGLRDILAVQADGVERRI